MAKYEITDNKTGKSVVVEGSKPPTTTDAEAIFQKAGLRQTTTQPEPQKGILRQVTEFLLPRASNVFNDVGKAVGLQMEDASTSKAQNDARVMNEKLVARAKAEQDPVKKAQLFKAAQSISENLRGAQTDVQFSEDVNQSPLSRGFGASGEIGAYLVPQSKLVPGAGPWSKIGNAALQSGEIGTLLGLTDPTSENAGERVQKGVTQGAIGVATGGVVEGLFQVGKAGFQKLVGNAPDKINKIIRPNPSTLDKFKKNTGLDYAEEIVKKDAKNIEGMDYSQLESYFKGKFQDAVGKVDSELANSGKTIDKKFIQNTFEEVSNLYKDRPSASSRIGQDFKTYIEYIDQLPDNIPLSTANQIKRDLQELASSAYGNTSNSVPKAYQKVAARLNKEIVRIYPQAGELNKETQLYKLVSDAVSRTSSREQNKISTTFVDKLLQSVPTTGGALATVATGNPLIGLGTLLAGAGASKAREVYRSPQVQTSLASMIQKGVSPRLNSFGRVLGDTVRKGSSILSTR